MLGVIAPCELRWLRMYDRNLWALVQSVGRPSVFVEQLAAFSHYTSECYYKRKKVSQTSVMDGLASMKLLSDTNTNSLIYISITTPHKLNQLRF